MLIINFSIKERISEIGIRKAFGADSADNILQFVLETTVVSVAASICGVIVAVVLLAFTLPVLNEVIGIELVFRIKAKVL